MIADVAALFLTGLVTIVGQIVLLRELNVAFYGIELIYLIGFGIWMFLIAMGSLAGGRNASAGKVAVLFLCLAVVLPAGVVFLRASRSLLGGVPGAYLSFPLQMAALVIALLPVCLLSGLLFRAAAVLHAERGRTLAGAYGIESAGALAGGLLATVCLRYGLQNFSVAVACGLVSVVSAFFIFPKRGGWAGRLFAVILAAAMIGTIYRASAIDRRMTAWNHPGLLATRDSPYGRTTVTALDGQVSVFENDALAFETEGAEPEIFAHLAALQHPDPRRILVLGGGWDGTLRELLRHRPFRIDAVVLDFDSWNLLRRHLPADIRASVTDPAVRFSRADPRHFLKNRGFAWDLILVGMPEPTSGLTNRFYTLDFFVQCRARLHRGGVVALHLPASENLWTPQSIRRTASIHRALASVFHETLILPGSTTVITASAAPLPRSPEIMIDRLQERGLKTRLVTPRYIRYLFENDRFDDIGRRLRDMKIPMNTDDRPACYPFAVMSWLARFYPKLALVDLPGYGISAKDAWKGGLFLGIGLLVLFLGSHLQTSWRRWMLAAVAGFLGIVSESVIILDYQAKEGALYQDIGLLFAAFMAGLALGAPVLRDLITGKGFRKGRPRRWGVALLIAFCLFGFATIGTLVGGTEGGLLLPAVLLAVAGFLVGGLFAYAGIYGVREQKAVIGPLYAADLLGGCVGAFCAGIVLIPVFGLSGTMKGIILLAALSLFLV